ncbi:hypothetical protein [Massilia sp. Se16.2.3]|uniref:hypothetical protein n=1 Tax=Massilia sp. Se16.2.3 TaxID=2709303 RepID=UPI0028042AED|nr:hypothetical protein [Massilia sp. Se16.2.3]
MGQCLRIGGIAQHDDMVAGLAAPGSGGVGLLEDGARGRRAERTRQALADLCGKVRMPGREDGTGRAET